MPLPTNHAELLASGATCIAEVSSLPDAPEDRDLVATYTSLAIWWTGEEERPFIAEVRGLLGPAAPATMVERWRASSHGTLDSALASFDPTNLRDDLEVALPLDIYDAYPDANKLRQRRAQANRGYKGEANMREAIDWLYNAGGLVLPTGLAKRLEVDFGVPWRTAYNAINGGALTGWAVGFIALLRHFDRGAWAEAKRQEQRTHDSTSAIDDELPPRPHAVEDGNY